MKLTVGVMGSAGGDMPPAQRQLARSLGRAVGEHDCILVTGAPPGLPLEAALGAKEAGALVVGISPGHSIDEHTDVYGCRVEGHDVIIYTGSGLMGREIAAIRSSDIVVIVGGRSGTLGEFAIAYDEGKLIGTLAGSGGIADHVDDLLRVMEKDTGAHVISDADPERLVAELVQYYREVHSKHPSVFARRRADH